MVPRRDLTWWLLATCVLLLGAGRRAWGRGMLAELAHIEEPGARRAFARGSAFSLLATVPHRGATGAVALGGLVAAASSLALLTIAVVRYPGIAPGVGSWVAIGLFVVVLAAYVVAALHVAVGVAGGRWLGTALLAGAAIASTWLGIGFTATHGGSPASSTALVALGAAVAVAVGWLASRARPGWEGVSCVGLAGLVAGFVVFLAWAGQTLVTATGPHDAATRAVDDGVGTAMMLLLLVPLLCLASGLVGTAAARVR